MAGSIPKVAQKAFTAETLHSAAKQSQRCSAVPVRLQSAIEKYVEEQETPHMRRSVLRLSESFNEIKDINRELVTAAPRELVDEPTNSTSDNSKRWKIKSSYGDIGLKYRDNETLAYVASRMPAVYTACHRVLKEVRRRLPDFSPASVLDFGSGSGAVLWALQDVWPRSLTKIHLVEPSKSMQRAAQSLALEGMKDLPLIGSYDSIQDLNENLKKSNREHDLVVASYVLGEVPSIKDRITIVRQLWDLTQDVLVLVEPGTPEGFRIISQMRSHILWMTKRKCRKALQQLKKCHMSDDASDQASEDIVNSNHGAFVVAPCPHDGPCPLENSGTFCHFVQRLERTSSQRLYKRVKGRTLRGFEDEKFCFVALRRGQRPREPWPLDGMKFETLKEMKAKRNTEDLEPDYEDQLVSEVEGAPSEDNPVSSDYDDPEMGATTNDNEFEEGEEEAPIANLGSGWGRVIFSPVRRGRQVTLNVCRSTSRDGSEGSFERLVITQSDNPSLHRQARKSFWGDLWPF